MKSILRPCTIRQATAFVAAHHRHSDPPRGGQFAIAALTDENPAQLVGVCIVGRPVARRLQDGVTAEVTRLCVTADAPQNTCSRLYRAAWRAWSAMGGARLVTYTLERESGASLRGAGFKLAGGVRPQSWNKPSRPRTPRAIESEAKQRWELAA